MSHPRNEILIGDCIKRMRELPAGIVQTCVTSPPYWGLRDYGIAPRLWADGSRHVYGLEPTPELFVQHSVEVFGEVRRIMRDDGTLWLNFGDSYQSGKGMSGGANKFAAGEHTGDAKQPARRFGLRPNEVPSDTMKPGDQVLIPHRVALALQADGWYLRSTIIWHKRSPMPESMSGWRWVPCKVKVGSEPERAGQSYKSSTPDKNGKLNCDCVGGEWIGGPKWSPCPGCDKCRANNGLVLRRGKWRPTTGHEYIFLFSKSEQYFCDGDAVQEAATYNVGSVASVNTSDCAQTLRRDGGRTVIRGETRNPRSVWTLSSEPFKGAHFATFPSEIPRRAISAGTSSAGCCSKCGQCWAPVVESQRVATRTGADSKVNYDPAFEFAKAAMAMSYIGTGVPIPEELKMKPREEIGNRDPQRHVAVSRVTGYRATCGCGAPAQPCLVFDPFGGSGTTAQVAKHLGRDYIITELNPEYAALAEKRIATPLRDKTKKPAKKKKLVTSGQRSFNF